MAGHSLWNGHQDTTGRGTNTHTHTHTHTCIAPLSQCLLPKLVLYMCVCVCVCVRSQEVPADCVILSTSDEGHICHVETANLDGETNLKLKNAFQGTQTAHTADQLSDFEHR